MARCPKCGSEVSSPKKKWTMAGRPDKMGKRMQLEIGLFDCPRCKKPFRVVLNKRKIQSPDIKEFPKTNMPTKRPWTNKA